MSIIKKFNSVNFFWHIDFASLAEKGCDNWKKILFFDQTTITYLHYTVWNVSKYEVFSGPYFAAFGQNTERYFVYLGIQSECGKIRTRKNSVFWYFSRSVHDLIGWIPKIPRKFPTWNKSSLRSGCTMVFPKINS